MKRANYVRNIKSVISSTFGKAVIGKIPGHKATMENILKWKTSPNVKWVKENLWNRIEGSTNDDTYMNRIKMKYSRKTNV